MKKIIARQLISIMLLTILFALVCNIFWYISSTYHDATHETDRLFQNVEKILSQMTENSSDNFLSIQDYFDLLSDLRDDAELYIIDAKDQKILGSTRSGLAEQDAFRLGVTVWENGQGISNINGEKRYFICKVTDSWIFLRTFLLSSFCADMIRHCVLWVIFLLLFALLTVVVNLRFIDKTILKSFAAINYKLVQITQGDLDVKLVENTTPEFAELSSYINEMVHSLMYTMEKISLAFEEAELPICVYEYGPGMRRVMATNRIGEILCLSPDETMALLSDSELFSQKLDAIQKYPIYPGSRIYRMPGAKERYIRMEAFFTDKYMLGVLVDETQSTLERQRIEKERDMDLLTELYSRRALFKRVEKLLANPENLGSMLLVMADADGLKRVNDQYGHESGDIYLQAIANILKSCQAKQHIVGRRSGDEFVLFMYGGKNKEELLDYLNELLKQRDHQTVALQNGASVVVQFSIGLACPPEDGTDLETLLHRADARMYEEKKLRKTGR